MWMKCHWGIHSRYFAHHTVQTVGTSLPTNMNNKTVKPHYFFILQVPVVWVNGYSFSVTICTCVRFIHANAIQVSPPWQPYSPFTAQSIICWTLSVSNSPVLMACIDSIVSISLIALKKYSFHVSGQVFLTRYFIFIAINSNMYHTNIRHNHLGFLYLLWHSAVACYGVHWVTIHNILTSQLQFITYQSTIKGNVVGIIFMKAFLLDRVVFLVDSFRLSVNFNANIKETHLSNIVHTWN